MRASIHRSLSPSVATLLALLGLSVPFVASMLAACTADSGVDNLPPRSYPSSNNGSGDADGGGGGSTSADGSPSGGGGQDAPSGDGAVTATSACADLAAARCKREDSCTGGVHDLVAYGDEATCESRRSALCALELSSTGTAATPKTIEACALSIPAQTCADAFDEMLTTACAPPAGSLTSGAACIASSQCASTYCAIAPNEVCGACAAVPAGGDRCTTAEQCGARSGLTCAGGVCIPIGVKGAACNASIPCGFGLACNGSTATVAGTCQATPEDAGATCDPTVSGSCNAALGLRCDAVSKACMPIAYVAAGKPCGALDGGVTECAEGECVITIPDAGPVVVDSGIDAGAAEDAGDASADGGDGAADAGVDSAVPDAAPPSAPTVGLCVGAAKEGAACNLLSGPACLWPAACVVTADGGSAGVCALPNGTTCK